MKKIFYVLLITLFFSGGAFAADDEVLAKVGDRVIKKSDFERMISFYSEAQQKTIRQNPARQKALLERFVQSMAISKIAKEKGLDRKEGIKEQLEMLTDDFLTRTYIQQEVIAKLDITDNETELYYQQHKEEFTTPEMVKIRQILVRTKKGAPEEENKKARARVEGILKQIKGGEDFAKVASEASDDLLSKKKGGDLGFLRKGKMPPEFDKVAFSLKPGEMSDIIETPQGYHIIKVEEKKESETPSYGSIKEQVKARALDALKTSKIQEFLNKAMKDAGVEIHTELLGK